MGGEFCCCFDREKDDGKLMVVCYRLQGRHYSADSYLLI